MIRKSDHFTAHHLNIEIVTFEIDIFNKKKQKFMYLLIVL